MSLVAKNIKKMLGLRRSSTLRLSILLSVIFAIGFAIAISVALTLGQDAIERRVDETLATLAGAAEIDDDGQDSPSMILRPLDDLDDLPQPFGRAAERGGGTVQLRDDFLRSEIWRVLVTSDQDDHPVLIAVPLENSEQAQELLTGILWTTAGLVIALTLAIGIGTCLLYTSPSPRDLSTSRMPSSA